MILKMRIMYIRRYTHIHRDMWRGTQKFAELKKKIFKIFVQVWMFSYLQSTPTSTPSPPWLDSVITAPLPMLETLPKTGNLYAVKGRRRFSFNLCNVNKTPPFWRKTKRWLWPPPTLSSLDYALCDSFLLPGMSQDLKGRRLVDVA